MGIIRLLLYGVLVWLLVRLVKSLFQPELKRPGGFGGAGPRNSGQVEGGELVQDPQCGVYIPKDTALCAQGEYFCSVECRDAYRDRKRDN